MLNIVALTGHINNKNGKMTKKKKINTDQGLETFIANSYIFRS